MENTQFELKNIGTFSSEFPPISRNVIENSIQPFSIGLQPFFKWSLKICNLSLCSKVIKPCHFIQNFTPADDKSSKIQSDPSPLGYGIFFKNRLADFRKMFPGFLRVLFYIVKHIHLKIGHTVCQSFSPSSVRQSVSPSVIGI